MKKKLYKDKETGIVSGVISGFAQYFHTDVKLLRIIFASVAVFTHLLPCAIIYAVLAFIMPDKSETGHTDYKVE